jgi:NADH:ubiquinone reductase (H+-translocating)
MPEPTRIVILGGGFAGTNVARRLERWFRRDPAVQLTLIDAENFFTFTPLLPEVPSGSIQPKHIVFPLRALLRRTKVQQAELQAVDLDRREIVVRHCGKCGEYTVPFDQLVIALGSVSNFFGLPGVAEHALTIKSLADAAALHAHVIDKLEHADLQSDPARRRELLTFVVAGGGFAGVETLAELNDFVRGCGRFYPGIQPEDIRVVLIHSGPRILPEVSESLSAYALRKLRSSGVEVLLESRVQSCTERSVVLNSGESIPCRTFVWAAGVSPNPLLADLDLPLHRNGRLAVDKTLRVQDHPQVWALGDSAAVPDIVTGKLCPPTAQFALRQGHVLADNLAASMLGREGRPFRHRSLGLLAGLGRRCAVAEIGGLRFSGFFAWWLWRTIYLLKMPGLERKLRIMLDWTLDLFFPRDLVYLRSLHAAAGRPALSAEEYADSCACVVNPTSAGHDSFASQTAIRPSELV